LKEAFYLAGTCLENKLPVYGRVEVFHKKSQHSLDGWQIFMLLSTGAYSGRASSNSVTAGFSSCFFTHYFVSHVAPRISNLLSSPLHCRFGLALKEIILGWDAHVTISKTCAFVPPIKT
jgi:hypothetical protein